MNSIYMSSLLIHQVSQRKKKIDCTIVSSVHTFNNIFSIPNMHVTVAMENRDSIKHDF